MNTVKTRGLSAGSLFKVLFCGLLIPIFLFGLGCGIAAFFGADVVTFNHVHVHGLEGLIVGAIVGLFVPTVLAGFLWLIMIVGLWIWTRFSPINLRFKD
jgi:hypothetical protein